MSFRKGLRDGSPIGLGYFSVSLAFGVLAVDNGFSWFEALLISMTNLTSAGQFAGITVMTVAGSLIEMALCQLVINARYALMSISLSQKLSPDFHGWRRWLLGFFMTDEIFAVASGSYGQVTKEYFAGLTIAPFIGWSLGTLCGALLGSVLPPVVTSALGVALYGMFIAIVTPKAKESRPVLIVVAIAVAFSVLMRYTPVLSKVSNGFAIIICAIIAAAAGAVFFPVKEEN